MLQTLEIIVCDQTAVGRHQHGHKGCREHAEGKIGDTVGIFHGRRRPRGCIVGQEAINTDVDLINACAQRGRPQHDQHLTDIGRGAPRLDGKIKAEAQAARPKGRHLKAQLKDPGCENGIRDKGHAFQRFVRDQRTEGQGDDPDEIEDDGRQGGDLEFMLRIKHRRNEGDLADQ